LRVARERCFNDSFSRRLLLFLFLFLSLFLSLSLSLSLLMLMLMLMLMANFVLFLLQFVLLHSYRAEVAHFYGALRGAFRS
jgi:hypothetical protein